MTFPHSPEKFKHEMNGYWNHYTSNILETHETETGTLEATFLTNNFLNRAESQCNQFVIGDRMEKRINEFRESNTHGLSFPYAQNDVLDIYS